MHPDLLPDKLTEQQVSNRGRLIVLHVLRIKTEMQLLRIKISRQARNKNQIRRNNKIRETGTIITVTTETAIADRDLHAVLRVAAIHLQSQQNNVQT
jgi:hypothetical protein